MVRTLQHRHRDGFMAFMRSSDTLSVELLQHGEPLHPAKPWQFMPNIGTWQLRPSCLTDFDELFFAFFAFSAFFVEPLASTSRRGLYAGLAAHGRCGADDTHPCL